MEHTNLQPCVDVEQYMRRHERKSLLRFVTCGSVDDGKSTFIGRLLYESKVLLDDQLAALEVDSRKIGTQGGGLDFALLVDGLSAEREQGITIDVAYRFFSTDRRKFIVADAPGHEQYTRNMITGASTADVAVILIDARRGVLTQTRRHSYLVALLGIRKVVIAINKMDLVGYSRAVFDTIAHEYRSFASELGFADITFVPVSALRGDNITTLSGAMPWYIGPTLMSYLENVEVADIEERLQPMRMPVQWVNRPNQDFRGFSGRIVSGTVRVGDRIRVLPSGRESSVARIVTSHGDPDEAVAGQSVTITLTDQIDISRGDTIAEANAPAGVADRFEATIVWMGNESLLKGRSYLIKIGSQTMAATFDVLKYKVDVNTMEQLAANTLELNEIGVCTLATERPIVFDPYTENKHMGGFILIDRVTDATVGAGMIRLALRRSQNVHMQHLDVDRTARAQMKFQKPCVIWFTGLSGAGKSTLANLVEKKLYAHGCHTYVLDGDNLRHGLNKDLAFSDADRVENIRRVAEVAKLMVDAGLIVLSAFISPFRAERELARTLVGDDQFVEVHVDVPLETAERRDPKGLYKKARLGELKNFTGIDSAYEPPLSPDLHIETALTTAESAADTIMTTLRARRVFER